MSAPVHFELAGEPQSKARARTVIQNGRSMSYTPKETVASQARVTAAFLDARGPGSPSETATYGLRLSFHCGTRRRRDLDNMIKLVLDALNRVAFADDSQVTEIQARLIRGMGAAAASTIVDVYETDAASAGYLPPKRRAVRR